MRLRSPRGTRCPQQIPPGPSWRYVKPSGFPCGQLLLTSNFPGHGQEDAFGTGKTKNPREKVSQRRGRCHGPAYKVVSEKAPGDLLADHRWRTTAQDIHFHGRLDRAPVDFNRPAPGIEVVEFPRGNQSRVEQGVTKTRSSTAHPA